MANLDSAFGDMNFASEEAEENLSVYSIEDKNLPPHVLHVWRDRSGYQRISILVHCFSSMTIGSYFPSITKDGWKVVLKMKWHPYILDSKKILSTFVKSVAGDVSLVYPSGSTRYV